MNETSKSVGRWAPLLTAVGLLILGFGGGVLVGRATRAIRERRTEALERSAGVPKPDVKRDIKRQIAECRRDLAALVKPRVTPPASAAPPGEEKDVTTPETAAKVEALQKDVEECQTRETLAKAYVCGSIKHHSNTLATIINQSGCADQGRIGEFVVNSFDKCAEFEDDPPLLYGKLLEAEERVSIAASKSNRLGFSKETLSNNVKGSHERCGQYLGRPEEY